MNDFICSKCDIRMNHIFLVKDLGICVYCEKKMIVKKCLLCEEKYNAIIDHYSGYCSKVCRQIDTVDLNVNEEKKDIISKMINKSYLENQWNDKK